MTKRFDKTVLVNEYQQDIVTSFNKLTELCHGLAVQGGWWHALDDIEQTGPKLNRDKLNLLMLVTTEIAEAAEGARKDLMDDKLKHRKMEEVELADAIIRIFDYAGAHNLDIGSALIEKVIFNMTREDHKPENRAKDGGKKY